MRELAPVTTAISHKKTSQFPDHTEIGTFERPSRAFKMISASMHQHAAPGRQSKLASKGLACRPSSCGARYERIWRRRLPDSLFFATLSTILSSHSIRYNPCFANDLGSVGKPQQAL